MILIDRITSSKLIVHVNEYSFKVVIEDQDVMIYLNEIPRNVFCNYYGINSKIKIIRITSGLLKGTELDSNHLISSSLYYKESEDLGGLIYNDLKILYLVDKGFLSLRVEFNEKVVCI